MTVGHAAHRWVRYARHTAEIAVESSCKRRRSALARSTLRERGFVDDERGVG
jgi:hypothetical protein